jgi:hypothetical protein
VGSCRYKILTREAKVKDTTSATFVRQFLVAACIGFCEGGNELVSFIKHEIPRTLVSATLSVSGVRT